MEMNMYQQQSQKLILTQTMRESLEILQMGIPELQDYVRDRALSNPILEMEEPAFPALSDLYLSGRAASVDSGFSVTIRDYEGRSGQFSISASRVRTDDSSDYTVENYADREGTFSEFLLDQLRGVRGLDERQFELCSYLIYCLNEKGYLDCTLEELSEELRVSWFEMEDALRTIQSLQPVGVGARSLTECLLLQLEDRGTLDPLVERAVREGLPHIARNNFSALAKLLGCSVSEAREAAEEIRALEPIPSRGFSDGEETGYLIPEASISVEQGTIVIEMNRSCLPKVSCNQEIISLLRSSDDRDCSEYLQRNWQDAKHVIRCVQSREATIERLIRIIVQHQSGFFTDHAPLKGMTMAELSEELGVNRSTVSRTIRGKSVLFEGREIMLKDFFTSRLVNEEGEDVSSDSIKKEIRRLVAEEDPCHPLSDERIRILLEGRQMQASRRTVAKYREEIGIACSAMRKKR